jgi:hypothetical protein
VLRVLDLDALSTAEKDELGYLLRREAARERRVLSTSEALEAFLSAPVSEWWARSRYNAVGRIRIACRRLIVIDRWRREQIRLAMSVLAIHVCPDAQIAEMAVEAGIEDAFQILELPDPQVETEVAA